jgi:hypothetical protein
MLHSSRHASNYFTGVYAARHIRATLAEYREARRGQLLGAPRDQLPLIPGSSIGRCGGSARLDPPADRRITSATVPDPT